MKKYLLLLAFGVISSSSLAFMAPIPDSEANIEPKNYRLEILKALRSAIKDPTSVRDASISMPALKWMGVGERYVVCVRFNAKNSFGGYTGLKETMAIFLRGTLFSLDYPDMGQCRDVSYSRFPELEKMK